mgnify:CR=1 FL=1
MDIKKGSDVKKRRIARSEGELASKILDEKEEKLENAKSKLRENFYLIKRTLKKYIDMNEDYYELIALWIIGTYYHKSFESFPYLFFNAMRGSGKSKTLKLVTYLSNEGNVMASPTEAVLFRTNGTLGIDEFEGVGGKEKTAIRELLNSSYKRGTKIFRMKKQKTKDGEDHVAEEFEPYRPITMANIWGMEEVLGDRCLTIVLEKSEDPLKLRLSESFESNKTIKFIKGNFKVCSLCSSNVVSEKDCANFSRSDFKECSLCSLIIQKNIYTLWDSYLMERYKTTLTTLTTHTTNNTLTTQKDNYEDLLTTHTTLTTYNTYTTLNTLRKQRIDSFFNKIHNTEITGRNLELFMPLFLVASIMGDEALASIIKVAKKIVKERTHEEQVESRDVMVIDFVSRQNSENLSFVSITKLVNNFRDFLDGEIDWLNAKWLGRAFKRLSLVVDKRRTPRGIQVILNVGKAKQKLKMFKHTDQDETN